MARLTPVSRCEDCKYWDETPYYRANNELPQGECLRILYGGSIGRTTTMARLTDPGSLFTPADFGCTLWESK